MYLICKASQRCFKKRLPSLPCSCRRKEGERVVSDEGREGSAEWEERAIECDGDRGSSDPA
jgi:hypothetical protein